MQNTPTKPNPNPDLVVWHITDSALPTGAFAHSAGMETFIQSGEIDDPETFSVWLKDYLYQSTYGEALSARFAWQIGAEDIPLEEATERLRELDALTHATQTPKQLRVSMNSMGRRMSKVARIVAGDDPLVAEYDDGLKERRYKGNPGIAAGLLLGVSGADERTAVRAYLMQMATSMVQNAIRAIPLGQDAGQRILVGIYPAIDAFAEETLKHQWHDLGVTAPRLEHAQMAHEYLRSRMFMS